MENSRNEKQELLKNKLLQYLYDAIKSESNINGLITAYGMHENRELVCEYLADNEEEYFYYFNIYDLCIDRMRTIFKSDIIVQKNRLMQEIQQERQYVRQKPTIFGINLLLAIPLAIVVVISQFVKCAKK